MSKTYRDKPAKKQEIAEKIIERGNHRKMEPMKKTRRACRKDSWIDSDN